MRISDGSSDVCSSDLVRDLEATLAELGGILGLSPEQLALIREEVAEKEGYQPIQIAQDLDWHQFAAINVRLTELAGVQPIRGYARVYPTGPAVAHLLGVVGAAPAEPDREAGSPPVDFPGYKVRQN